MAIKIDSSAAKENFLPTLTLMLKMKQNIAVFKILIFLAAGIALSTMSGCSGMRIKDVSGYRSNILPETSRKLLPAAIRSSLPLTSLEAIERSAISVYSPPSKIGFSAKFEIKIQEFVQEISVECTPLVSGLLRCSRTASNNQSIDKRVQQGVYAFGGLVPLHVANYFSGREAVIYTVSGIRASSNAVPTLPSPGFDIVRDLDISHEGGQLKHQIQCVPATVSPEIPTALRSFGPISFVACRGAQSSLMPEVDRNHVEIFDGDAGIYDPGIPWGNLYLWLNSKGVALPAELFFPGRLSKELIPMHRTHELWEDINDQWLTKVLVTVDGITTEWVR